MTDFILYVLTANVFSPHRINEPLSIGIALIQQRRAHTVATTVVVTTDDSVSITVCPGEDSAVNYKKRCFREEKMISKSNICHSLHFKRNHRFFRELLITTIQKN